MVRAARRVALAATALIVLLAAAGLPLYVFPAAADTPRKVDVIMVLGGRQDGRENYGIALAEKGLASTVLVSNPYAQPDDYMEPICNGRHRVTVICFVPDPKTTRGEARYLRDQAKLHHWHSAMVVTFTPHVTRAEYIVARCFTGDLVMAEYSPTLKPWYWAYMYLYQTAGFIRAFAQDGC